MDNDASAFKNGRMEEGGISKEKQCLSFNGGKLLLASL